MVRCLCWGLGALLAATTACAQPAHLNSPSAGGNAPDAASRAAPSEPEPTAPEDPRPLIVDRVEVRGLTSEIHGVEYELRISLPHGYAEHPERRFPVVYTLDADYSFLIARNVTDHLAERNHLREVLVVGIAYGGPLRYRLHRTRDYTPTFVPEGGYGAEYQKVSGGGPKFLQALETEILPFVDRHYRTLPDRTLVGHSYGGLFTVWTLLTRPGLFDRYVSVSPSLWYDDGLALKLEETYARDHDALPARLYLCVGSREGNSEIDMVGDFRDFVAQLHGHDYEDLEFDHRVMENETHNSIFPGCLSNGLRFVLGGR